MEDSTESFEDSQEQRVYSALVAIVDGKVKEETPNAEPTQSKDMDVKTSNKDAPAQEDNADAPDMDPQMDVKDEAETNSDKDAPAQEVNADAPDMDPRMDVKDEAETNSDKDAPAQEENADMDVEADMDGIEPPAKHSSFLQPHAKAQFVSAVLA